MSEVCGPNVAGIRFSFAQPAYRAGIAVAGASRTGIIGDRIGTEVRQRLDSTRKEMESLARRSPVSWTARDR